ncbi:MAG TPA: sensor domain-containing diguanylate cyclase [Cycloclasticus sp.]|nr:sensor domain-containing diguanylate cyclase [Cycloclasticus sp.]
MFPVDVLITRIETDEGPLVHGSWVDVSKRKRIEKALQCSEAKYKTLFQGSAEAKIFVDKKNRIVDCNLALAKLFGYACIDEIIGLCPANLTPELQPDGRNSKEAGLQIIQKAFKEGSQRFEWYLLRNNGQIFPAEVVATGVILDGKPMLEATVRDMTDLKLDAKRLLDNERKYKAFFYDSVDAYLLMSADKLIVDCNNAAAELFGYASINELIGLSPLNMSPCKQPDGRHSEEAGNALIARAFKEGSQRFGWYHQRKNGEVFPVEIVVTSIVVDDEPMLHATLRDITEAKHIEAKLEGLAYYDTLTNLPNRRLFVERFNQASALSKRSKTKLATCFLDLDCFKPINDNYGHTVGDRLLVSVAERIRSSIREEDTVSRQGGDEFNILLTGIKSRAECEQSLQRVLHALGEPFLIDDVFHNISASIGVTIFEDDGSDLDLLIHHADLAMYQAKEAGRNRYCFYEQETSYRKGV